MIIFNIAFIGQHPLILQHLWERYDVISSSEKLRQILYMISLHKKSFCPYDFFFQVIGTQHFLAFMASFTGIAIFQRWKYEYSYFTHLLTKTFLALRDLTAKCLQLTTMQLRLHVKVISIVQFYSPLSLSLKVSLLFCLALNKQT